jgi:Rrf2 family protein
MAYLAAQPSGHPVGTREIAENEGIPHAFLGKVLLPFCRERLVRSRKGIGGGYELAAPPEQISLADIVRLVDGDPLKNCLVEDRECSATHPCLLHPSWKRLREQWIEYLERTTLAELAGLRETDSAETVGASES